MKMTLLEIVQSVLSSLDSDPVNDINEVEADQIALVAREVYNELAAYADWAKDKVTTQLESVIDVNRPNYLKIPDDIIDIQELHYESTLDGETKRTMRELTYCTPNDFLNKVFGRDITQTEVIEVEDFEGWDMWIYNERPPTYYTSFDDTYIITDAYDSEVETTLHSEKSVVNATRSKTFLLANNFIPPMPPDQFPAYLARVKEKAWFYDNRTNTVDRNEASRGLARLRRINQRVDQDAKPRNYGRNV